MPALTDRDYFRAEDLILDPYAYFGSLVAEHPVWIEPNHGVVLVSGFAEALAVLRNPAVFSSCNLVAGPDFRLPIAYDGDDVTELVDSYRGHFPQSDQIVTFDPPTHSRHRSLLMGLITPKRLKENEAFMWRLADSQLDQVLPNAESEIISEFAQPFTLLVIADLLGVPEHDHAMLLGLKRTGPKVGTPEFEVSGEQDVLSPFYDYFVEQIADRRAWPQDDVLTGMANARFPDGVLPEPVEVARIAANLFAAGQETTARLLGTALRYLADDHGLQVDLRTDRSLIPRFVEEVLRIEGPIKGEFRLALKTSQLGGVPVPAGTIVMVLNGAAGRDSREFEGPEELRVERPNARRHLGFGHGIHTCPGAPLARAEVRICIERIFDRTTDFGVVESLHGGTGHRHYKYLPSYMFRGLESLNLEFTPAG